MLPTLGRAEGIGALPIPQFPLMLPGMAHPFRVREIAAQAGLSEATVDRVLNRRGGVRASTVQEVHRAVADLERQQAQLQVTGQTFMLDVVVQAPDRFCTAVRSALEAELPSLRPAVIRARFRLLTGATVADTVCALERVLRNGSHGVVVKAPDVPEVVAVVARLSAAGIPVVTLVTDLPTSDRSAYVGLDNRAAGGTAAYLLTQLLGERDGDILVVRGRGSFRGEDDREMGFRSTLRAIAPGRGQVDVVDEQSRPGELADRVSAELRRRPGLAATYSMYAGAGGNTAVLDAFDILGRRCLASVAHDLDEENTVLLRQGRLTAVLHHDLRSDLRRCCQLVLQARKALPGPITARTSDIHVVTPYNLPAALPLRP